MRILSITAQKPHSTGSGTYLTELVRSFDAAGHRQAVVYGIYPDDTVDFPDGVACYPVLFTKRGDASDSTAQTNRGDALGSAAQTNGSGASESDSLAKERGGSGFESYAENKSASKNLKNPEIRRISFPVVGMSDIMPYESTRYRDLTPAMISEFEGAFIDAVTRAVTEMEPDLIICHHLFLLTALVRTHFSDRKIYGISHGTDLRQMHNCDNLREFVRPEIAKLDMALALHTEQATQIKEIFGMDDARVRVIGSGYNDKLFNTKGRIPRRKLLYVSNCNNSYASVTEESAPGKTAYVGSGSQHSVAQEPDAGSGSQFLFAYDSDTGSRALIQEADAVEKSDPASAAPASAHASVSVSAHISATASAPAPVRLCYAGKISRPKGVPEMLAALAELANDPLMPPFRLTMAGGCQDEVLLGMLGSLPSYVEYIGQIPQPALAELLRQTDIFILPSYFEGLPLVLIEAMASGAVPISTDLPGVREWIDANVAGSNAVYVPMPEMKSIDEPTDAGRSLFIKELARTVRAVAIRTAAAVCSDTGQPDVSEIAVCSDTGQPDTSEITWFGVASRIISLSSH